MRQNAVNASQPLCLGGFKNARFCYNGRRANATCGLLARPVVESTSHEAAGRNGMTR